MIVFFITKEFSDAEKHTRSQITFAELASLFMGGKESTLFKHMLGKKEIEIKDMESMYKIVKKKFPHNIIDWRATSFSFEV